MLRSTLAFALCLAPALGFSGAALAHPADAHREPVEEGGPLVSPAPGGQAAGADGCDRHHHGEGPGRGRGHQEGRGRGHHADGGRGPHGAPAHARGHGRGGRRGPPEHARGGGRGR